MVKELKVKFTIVSGSSGNGMGDHILVAIF